MASLQFLRRAIGRLTGDLDILVATSNGSTTTFLDVLNANVESNSWKGRLGYFSGGTAANVGSTVRLTANDKTTTTLSFLPAVAGTTAIGDTLELYNKDGQGPTIRHIHDTINLCIEFAGKGVLTEALDTAVTFDEDDPVLTIPASWRRLVAIEYRAGDDDTDDWLTVPEVDWVETVDRLGYTVRVDNISRYLANDYQIRLRGYTVAGQLSAETDTTLVDTEWLVREATSQILLNLATAERVPRDRAADYRATSQFMSTLANSFRSKVPTTVRGAGGVVLGGGG